LGHAPSETTQNGIGLGELSRKTNKRRPHLDLLKETIEVKKEHQVGQEKPKGVENLSFNH